MTVSGVAYPGGQGNVSTSDPQIRHMANNGASPSRKVTSRVAASLLALAVALQSGCGFAPPLAPQTGHQDKLGKVAVVAIPQETEFKLAGFPRGKAAGAARAAGGMLGECLRGPCGGSGDPVCLAFIVICGVVAIPVAAVVGGATAPDAGEVQAAEATVSSNFDAKIVHDVLRDEVMAAALAQRANVVTALPDTVQAAARLRDYRPLAAGVDTVVEVSMTKVGARGGRVDGPLYLYMQAHVRLVRTSDNAEVFTSNYVYNGVGLKLSEGSASQAEQLLRALLAGYETLGSHIYDNVFLIYPFPSREPQSAGTIFGLVPIYPANSMFARAYQRDPVMRALYPETTVDSLQPTFRWEAFPRAADIAAAPGEMGRVKNVRYDLVIAREQDRVPAEIVYRREGLPDTTHTIKTTLSPATGYFWTVRARFELDGRLRVTEWSSSSSTSKNIPAGMSLQEFESWLGGLSAPSHLSYRFLTQ